MSEIKDSTTSLKNYLTDFFSTWLKARRWSLPTALLMLSVLLYCTYFGVYQLQRHRAFWTNIDTVNMEQTLWNTLHGRFARSTVYPPTGGVVEDFTDRVTVSRLGSHVQPIQLVLLLPYALFQRPEVLLLLTATATGLGAIPVYRIARRRLLSSWLALAFAVSYLLIPAVETSSSWDAHGNTLVLPLVLAAFDALDTDNRGWWWLWSLLAMGCREDLPFLVGWAMVWMAPKPRRREALIMFSIGLMWSLLSFLVVIPAFGGGGTPYIVRFLPAGTPLTREALFALLRRPAFWQHELRLFISYNVRLALPVFFLYWLYWPAVIAVAPLLLINGLSWYAGASFPSLFHYSTPAMPWVIVGAIESFRRLTSFLGRWRPTLRWRVMLAEALLVTVVLTNYMEGYLPWSRGFIWPRQTGRELTMRKALARIPDDVALSAEMQLLAHEARRETLRFFPDTRSADWIALDLWHGLYPYSSFEQVWSQVRADPTWETALVTEGLILLRRGSGPPADLEKAFVPPAARPLLPLHVQFGTTGQEVRLVGVEARPRPVNYLFFCTDWEVKGTVKLLPQVAISSSPDADFIMLDASRLVPETFEYSGRVRDCTTLLTPRYGDTIPVRLEVRDPSGVAVPVQVQEFGAWEERVTVEGSTLVFDIPPWW